MEALVLDRYDYDLDGLLGKAEMNGADFIFMTYEEETESYYMDRMELQKYDTRFGEFLQRIEAYLEKDESHSLFILFATIRDGVITLYDGTQEQFEAEEMGDIDLEGDSFYGMMLHFEENDLICHQAVYLNAHYEGNGRAALIHNAGVLTDRLEEMVQLFV